MKDFWVVRNLKTKLVVPEVVIQPGFWRGFLCGGKQRFKLLLVVALFMLVI